MATLDGSRELGTLILGLYRRHGASSIPLADVSEAILEVTGPSPGGLSVVAYLQLCLSSLLRCGYVRESDGLLALTEKSLTFARALEDADERELAAISANPGLLFVEAESVAAPAPVDEGIERVTREFLEEALAEAGLPDELIDAVFETYATAGRLTMSADGGQYRLRLAR